MNYYLYFTNYGTACLRCGGTCFFDNAKDLTKLLGEPCEGVEASIEDMRKCFLEFLGNYKLLLVTKGNFINLFSLAILWEMVLLK